MVESAGLRSHHRQHHGHDHAHPGGDRIDHEHGTSRSEPAPHHAADHVRDERRGGRLRLIQSVFPLHGHESADSVDSSLESSAKGIRAVKFSLAALMVTAAAQVVVVLMTGSVALLADTIHNFSDALTSIPLWIAFILGRRAANRRYTFGYRRAEDLAGLFIVAMIGFSAVVAGWESINRLLDPQPITNLGLVMGAGVLGFIGNELVAAYRIRVGKEIGSAALVADGYHARTDGFTSLAVVAGVIGVAIGFPQADPLVGLMITIVILWILKDAVGSVFGRLMDAVDPSLVDDIERRSLASEGIEGVTDVHARWIGHRLEVSLSVVVDCDVSVAAGHAIANELRRRLVREIRGLDDVLVHVDPCLGH